MKKWLSILFILHTTATAQLGEGFGELFQLFRACWSAKEEKTKLKRTEYTDADTYQYVPINNGNDGSHKPTGSRPRKNGVRFHASN